MSTKKSDFNKYQAYDDIMTIFGRNPIKPSDVLKVQNDLVDYIQGIHETSYTQGFESALNLQLPKSKK